MTLSMNIENDSKDPRVTASDAARIAKSVSESAESLLSDRPDAQAKQIQALTQALEREQNECREERFLWNFISVILLNVVFILTQA